MQRQASVRGEVDEFMRNVTRTLLLVVVLLSGTAACCSIPTPLIDLSVDPSWTDKSAVKSWRNAGSLAGAFISDGNKSTAPPVINASYVGKVAVEFQANQKLILSSGSATDNISLVRAPSSITGNGTFTVIAQIASFSALPDLQYYLAFAKFDSNGGKCASFGYGSNAGYGAVAHRNAAYDMGWNNPEVAGGPSIKAWHYVGITFDGAVEKVYLDGAEVNRETKTLSVYAGHPFVLGCRFTGDNAEDSRNSAFRGALASLKLYDAALSPQEVALLSEATLKITSSAGPGGSITPAEETIVTTGADQSYTITPNAGYRVLDVLVDGKSIGAASTHTFSNVLANHTISARFTPVSVSDVKSAANDAPVTLTSKAVTAVFGDSFYIEETDMSCGIRVDKPGHGMVAGKKTGLIEGTAQTDANGEKYIQAAAVGAASDTADVVSPVLIDDTNLGGAPTNSWDASSGAGQRGVDFAGNGLNNIGLLVKITGSVTAVGSDFFYVDGGIGASDGSVFRGIKVKRESLATMPARGQNVTVTGISSIRFVGGAFVRSFRSVAWEEIKQQ